MIRFLIIKCIIKKKIKCLTLEGLLYIAQIKYMKFNAFISPIAMAHELGERLKRTRLNLNLTQEEVALSAGISRYTVKKLEQGDGKVQDLMALNSTDQLDSLLAPQLISPIQLLKLRVKIRKRASGVNRETPAGQRKEINEEDIGW